MDRFDSIKLNPFDVPLGMMIWDYYKSLGRRAHLSSIPVDLFKHQKETPPKEKDLHLLVGYVILLVDKNSPFYDETDFDQRRHACLEAMSIKKGTALHGMIMDDHWWYCLVLSTYFNMQNVQLFESWLSLLINASRQKAYLRGGLSGDAENQSKVLESQAKIAKQLKDMDKDLRDMEKQLFGDSEVRDAVQDAVTSDFVGYPELFAKDHFP